MPEFYPEQSKNFIIYRKGGVSAGEILDVNESNRIDGYPCFLVLRRCPETVAYVDRAVEFQKGVIIRGRLRRTHRARTVYERHSARTERRKARYLPSGTAISNPSLPLSFRVSLRKHYFQGKQGLRFSGTIIVRHFYRTIVHDFLSFAKCEKREEKENTDIYIYIYTDAREKIYGLFHGERWINWLHVSTRVNYRNRGTCACKLIFFCTLRFLHDSLDFPFAKCRSHARLTFG